MHKVLFILLTLFATQTMSAQRFFRNDFLTLAISSENIAPRQIEKIEAVIKSSLLDPVIINHLEHLDVSVVIKNNALPISLSNASSNCHINVNYDTSLKGVLLKNFYQDLQFTIYHEISHCVLGKKIFRQGIDWNAQLNLSKENINQFNLKIKSLTEETTLQCSAPCVTQNVFNKPPPLTVYHEMFADIMAMFLYQRNNCREAFEILPEITLYRYEKYHANPVKNIHQSFLAFNYWNNDKFCGKEIDFNKISFYTQKGFIDYLNETKTNE